MRKSTYLSVVAAVFAMVSMAQAQSTTTVSFDSGDFLLYSNAAKTTPLSAGVAAVAGDGAMLQLGYYTQATTANPFAGTFISLAGQGSANVGLGTAGNISIGDAPADTDGTPGTFALTLSFVVGNATSGNNLPAAGQLLAIQFYNGATRATSTLYNAVSNALWVFPAPANPPSTVNLSLNQNGLVYLGGAGTAFYTSQAVPEPSSIILLSVGAVGAFALLRRRMANA